MSKIKFFLLWGLIIATIPLYANNYKPEKRIYLMDLSGSMTGLGSVRTDNVLDKMKADLKGTINWVPTNSDFVFIPFTEDISPYIKGTSEEKPVLIGHISDIDIMPGNTDIASAWARGLAELDSTKVNYLFLLSDGYHNRGISKQEFYSTLHNWSNDNSNYDVEAYFVLLSPQYRTTEVAKIFDSTDRMQVVESMNIIRQTASAEADTAQISTTVSPVSSTSDKAFSWCWVWIVLVILIIVLLTYLIIHYLPRIFNTIPSSPLNKINNTPIKQEKEPENPEEPAGYGYFVNKNLFHLNKNYTIPNGNQHKNPLQKTSGDLGRDLGDYQPEIKFKNGYPVFDRDGGTYNKKPLFVEIDGGIGQYLKTEEMQTGGKKNRMNLHIAAFKKMSSKYGIDYDELQVFKGNAEPVERLARKWSCSEEEVWEKCKNPHKIMRVLHECEDCKTIQLVPWLYHHVDHNGGIEKISSMFQNIH